MKEKRMDKAERRIQILQSALSVFIEKGFNGTTTIDIANRAGISEVTVFRYFDSKKEIFMESIKPILLENFKDSLSYDKNLDAKVILQSILKERILFIKEERAVIKLILMESEINPELADVNYIEAVTSILNTTLSSLNLELKANEFVLRMLMGSILSFLYMPANNELDIDLYVKSLVETIII